MRKKLIFILSAIPALLALSCQKASSDSRYTSWLEEPEETVWTDAGSKFGTLPSYVKLYYAEELEGQKAVAYIADIDLSKKGFCVWGLDAPDLNGCSDPLQTPLQIYNSKEKPCIVINAGFFYSSGGKNYSSSLEVSDGVLLSPNINYASQDWVKMYYPTRGVFLEHADGSYEVAWTFFKDKDHHYIYDSPAANSWSSAPLKVPDATFPVAGRVFEAKNGIGGGPVLIKAGKIKNTYPQELFDGPSGIMCDSRHPRTAIGLTAEKHLVLFVCEGRNMTPSVPGFTTMEVARILQAYGCTDALNLDGGGSTLMLVNGKEVLKPSDGKQRAVGSCIYIQ